MSSAVPASPLCECWKTVSLHLHYRSRKKVLDHPPLLFSCLCSLFFLLRRLSRKIKWHVREGFQRVLCIRFISLWSIVHAQLWAACCFRQTFWNKDWEEAGLHPIVLVVGEVREMYEGCSVKAPSLRPLPEKINSLVHCCSYTQIKKIYSIQYSYNTYALQPKSELKILRKMRLEESSLIIQKHLF